MTNFFSFELCVNCDELRDIPGSLLCSRCFVIDIPSPDPVPPGMRTIFELKSEEIGYVSLDAIFIMDGNLWIITCSNVSDRPTDIYTVEIFRDDENDFILHCDIDGESISRLQPKGLADKWFEPLYTEIDLDDDQI